MFLFLLSSTTSRDWLIQGKRSDTLCQSGFIVDQLLLLHSYKDNDPLIGLCVEAQQYYKQHGIATCVKACSAGSLDEILQLAGVDAYTIETSDLDALAKEQRDQVQLETLCLFKEQNNTSAQSNAAFSSYVDDECRFRMDLAASKQGQSQFKLYQLNSRPALFFVSG